MASWVIEIELDLLGLSTQDQQTVENALPIAAKLLDHANANRQLFDTIYADAELVAPAALILANALNAKGITFQSLLQQGVKLRRVP